MTVNAINGSLLSALSAVDGVTLSTLNAINGQALAGGAPASGDLVFLGSADVEPTAGGNPNPFSSGTPSTVTTPAGVHGRCWDASVSDPVIALVNPVSPVSAGFRFQLRALPGVGVVRRMIRFVGGGGENHTAVQVNNSGGLQIVRSTSTVLDGPTSGLISINTWYYLELTSVIDDSAGSFTCNLYDDSGTLLNTGGDALTASGVDTRDGTGASTASTIPTPDNSLDAYIEDFWVDATGQLYGRVQVETVGPTGAGALTQLTRGGTDSGANWSQVDEVPVSATVDYNASTGADQYDCYTFPAIAVSGTPQGVGVYAANILSSGTPQFNYFVRISGVNYEHSTVFTATSTNKFTFAGWRNNPATGNAWTASEINAAEFGIRWRAANGRTHGLYRATLVQL